MTRGTHRDPDSRDHDGFDVEEHGAEVGGEDTATDARPRMIDAMSILGPDGTVEISLDDQVYTLRLTKQRKLLLTK